MQQALVRSVLSLEIWRITGNCDLPVHVQLIELCWRPQPCTPSDQAACDGAADEHDFAMGRMHATQRLERAVLRTVSRLLGVRAHPLKDLPAMPCSNSLLVVTGTTNCTTSC